MFEVSQRLTKWYFSFYLIEPQNIPHTAQGFYNVKQSKKYKIFIEANMFSITASSNIIISIPEGSYHYFIHIHTRTYIHTRNHIYIWLDTHRYAHIDMLNNKPIYFSCRSICLILQSSLNLMRYWIKIYKYHKTMSGDFFSFASLFLFFSGKFCLQFLFLCLPELNTKCTSELHHNSFCFDFKSLKHFS